MANSRSANEFSRDFYLRDDVIALDLGEDGPEKVGLEKLCATEQRSHFEG